MSKKMKSTKPQLTPAQARAVKAAADQLTRRSDQLIGDGQRTAVRATKVVAPSDAVKDAALFAVWRRITEIRASA